MEKVSSGLWAQQIILEKHENKNESGSQEGGGSQNGKGYGFFQCAASYLGMGAVGAFRVQPVLFDSFH